MNSTKFGFWILIIFLIAFKISDVHDEIKAATPPPRQIETEAEPETVLFLLLFAPSSSADSQKSRAFCPTFHNRIQRDLFSSAIFRIFSK